MSDPIKIRADPDSSTVCWCRISGVSDQVPAVAVFAVSGGRAVPAASPVAASTTLLAESRAGRRGGALPWSRLVAGSIASLGANVAVAEPDLIGRIIAVWPSFALTASYELLTRQVRGSVSDDDGQPPMSSRRTGPGYGLGRPGRGVPRGIRSCAWAGARSAASGMAVGAGQPGL